MDTTEAARRLGLTRRRITQLCRAGALLCERHGRDWWITEAAVAAYVPPKVGRPVTTGAGLRRRRKEVRP